MLNSVDIGTAVSTAIIVWAMLFGCVGLGFFIYGKRQRAMVPLICGLSLMIFPYFITNVILLVIIGTALIAIPYFIRY